MVCSILLGKFFRVQIGILTSHHITSHAAIREGRVDDGVVQREGRVAEELMCVCVSVFSSKKAVCIPLLGWE
jgi:hypothetical protein